MADVLSASAAIELQSIVSRIERFEQERTELSDIIKDLMTEAKNRGFDKKTIRKVLAIRRQDPAKYVEQADMIDLYLSALGDEHLARAA